MYEIWLGLNIFVELWLVHQAAILPIVVAWLLLIAYTVHRKPLRTARVAWIRSLNIAIPLSICIGATAFFLLPGLTRSGFYAMGYWVDWVALTGMASGTAFMALMFICPLFTLCQPIPER